MSLAKVRRAGYAAVVALAAMIVHPAVAQTVATPAVAAVPAPMSPMGGLVQSLLGLVVVVALIYGAAWLLRRLGPRTRPGNLVQVLGGASVGPREKVVVVRFGGETLLLGVAPGHVSLLQSAVDAGAIAVDDAPAAPRFIDRLRAAKNRS